MIRTRIAQFVCASAFAALVPAQAPTGNLPLRVYVLAGQSNMQGHAKIATFDYMEKDEATAPLLAEMRGSDGKPTVCDRVWISDLSDGEGHGKLTAGYGARRDMEKPGDNIGPEFTFGLEMQKAYAGPILLVKTSWGGKSLHTDFRPPSAGEFPFSEAMQTNLRKQNKDVDKEKAEKEKVTGHFYGLMVEHVRKVLADPGRYCPAYDKNSGMQLCGFVWFQGWNDMVDSGVYPQRDQPGGYAAYSECLADFIRDVRKDLEQPDLPFVIGVMGVGGPVADGDKKRQVHANFQAAMAAPAALPEFRGNVLAVPTAPFWAGELEAIADKLEKVKAFERSLKNPKTKTGEAPVKLSDAEITARVAEFRSRTVTSAEEAAYRSGASNAGYHYLGCAKTMARIGVAFAKGMQQLEK